MATNPANVMFKRGPQASLPTTAVDGVFYLTTDTNRLYVGQGNNGAPILLNKVVEVVATEAALQAKATNWSSSQKLDHVGDFYFITEKNVLAVFRLDPDTSTYKFVQINPDTNYYINSATAVSAKSGTSNIVNTTLTLGYNTAQLNDITATQGFKGTGGINLGVDSTDGKITIDGNEYKIERSIASNAATLTVKGDNTSNTSTSVVFSNTDGNVTFTSTGANGIVINTKDTYTDSISLNVNNGTISGTATNNKEGTVPFSLSNVGIALHGNKYSPLVSTAGLTADEIYGKTEIDSILSGLNGMTFKGTVGSSNASTTALPTTGVSVGDVYIITTEGLTASSAPFSGVTFSSGTSSALAAGTRVGDMVIAKGTEVNGKITSGLEWTYIPSGNDNLDPFVYKGVANSANHSWTLKDGLDSDKGKIAFVAGTQMAISSTATGDNSKDLTVTIGHKAISRSDTTAAAADKVTTFDIVTAVSTTTNGHVTGVTTKNITIMGYEMGSTSVTATNNVAAVGISLKNSADTTINTATFNIKSTSLQITSTAVNSIPTAVVDLVWGDF